MYSDTFFLIPNWKWMAIVLGLVGGFLLVGLSRQIIHHLKQKYGNHEKLPQFIVFFLEEEIPRPTSWLITLGLWHFLIEILVLNDSVTKVLNLLIHLMVIYHVLRLSYMAVEAAGKSLEEFVKTTENTLDDQLAPFATKVLKFLVVSLGILLSLQSLGFNVGAVLAGLGIGSLALALAAQDTAANLFGSITIILDRPFQRGDYIKVGDTEGTVEEVGFRSTAIRTFYKSIVTIPNSTMAKEKIDNMGARPARRIRHSVGLSYETSPEKMISFIDRVRYHLCQHPQLLKDEVTVVFQSMGDFDLKILINCFALVPDANAELKLQQEILFEVMKIAKETGVEFAYPTQTLHVATLPFK